MTIREAENQYDWEVANSIAKSTERHKKQMRKAFYIWMCVGFILIILGIVLILIGVNTPPKIDFLGNEYESFEAGMAKTFGGLILFYGVGSLAIALFCKHKKKKPDNFLPQIRNLYLNYLKCEDMSKDDKEYYIQKLEEIRNMELVSAVHSAAAAASTAATTAIMFSALKK